VAPITIIFNYDLTCQVRRIGIKSSTEIRQHWEKAALGEGSTGIRQHWNKTALEQGSTGIRQHWN